MNRRGFLTGLLAAPALIAASRLDFGVPKLILPPDKLTYDPIFLRAISSSVYWSADSGLTWTQATRCADGAYSFTAPRTATTIMWMGTRA